MRGGSYAYDKEWCRYKIDQHLVLWRGHAAKEATWERIESVDGEALYNFIELLFIVFGIFITVLSSTAAVSLCNSLNVRSIYYEYLKEN